MATSYITDPAPKLSPVLEGKKVVFSREGAEKPKAAEQEQPKAEQPKGEKQAERKQ